MEEALEILWTYARREPIESNGKTIVATISQSIAAIRLIIRLEGGLQRSEKRKVNNEKQATPAYATPTITTHDLPTSVCKGKTHDSGSGEQSAQPNIDAPISTCLVTASPRERKLRTSRQEPNLPTAKASYHVTKPRKVCHQHSAAKEDLYKENTLIGSSIRGVSLHRFSNLTLTKALPP